MLSSCRQHRGVVVFLDSAVAGAAATIALNRLSLLVLTKYASCPAHLSFGSKPCWGKVAYLNRKNYR